MTTTKTAGQTLTATIRRVKGIGTSSRWGRTNPLGGRLTHADVMATLIENGQYRGIYSEATTAALAPGFAIACGWDKHVEGYRINGEVIAALRALSPWQLCAFLGRLVDAGITNVGEMETWLAQHGREYVKAA